MGDLLVWALREGEGIPCCSKEMQCTLSNTVHGTHSALKQGLFCVREFMSMPAFLFAFLSAQYSESQIVQHSAFCFFMSCPVPI